MNRLMALAVLTAAVLGVAAVKSEPTPTAQAASPPVIAHQTQELEADITSEVQAKLKSYGYTIVVDGIYGPQTTGVVRSWQRSNGLYVDGITGPITQASLGLSPADRGPAEQVADTLPPPPPVIPHYDAWIALAKCESNSNWQINTGNGYYGGLQFARQSWLAVDGDEFAAYPHQATMEQQMIAAERLLDIQGWGAWPTCSRKVGLR
jgi:peptidoglycan hydrolase-like protein with peptidoglycan-binding domain